MDFLRLNGQGMSAPNRNHWRVLLVLFSSTWNQPKQTTHKLVESNIATDISQPNSTLICEFSCEPKNVSGNLYKKGQWDICLTSKFRSKQLITKPNNWLTFIFMYLLDTRPGHQKLNGPVVLLDVIEAKKKLNKHPLKLIVSNCPLWKNTGLAAIDYDIRQISTVNSWFHDILVVGIKILPYLRLSWSFIISKTNMK